jgi:hypothetical protein
VSTITLLANMSAWVSPSIFNAFQTSWALLVCGRSRLLLIAPRINLCRTLTSEIRVCPNGSLENLHLIVVPFYDCHTPKNITAMICRILDALYACWRSKIIAFNTDGENTMIRRHACVITRVWDQIHAHLVCASSDWSRREGCQSFLGWRIVL